MKQTQKQKSTEIHGKTAPEAIYKEMQRRTKDKAEEENLVQKNALSALLMNGEGQGVSANATHGHRQQSLQEKTCC